MTINDINSFIELEHLAAGHPGALSNEDGSLFAKPTKQQEIDFYNVMQEQEEGDIIGSNFKDWMPNYFGVLEAGISAQAETAEIDEEIKLKLAAGQQDHQKYILLENLLNGFNKPSIMDIKLGSKLYDETLNEDKKQRMIKVSRETTSGSMGFRICGMKIIPRNNDVGHEDIICKQMVSKDDEYLSLNKLFGRSLNQENVIKGFEIFFQDNELSSDIQQDILRIMHVRLQMIYNCLLDTKFSMVSGSLFFIFENDISKWQDEDLQDELVYQYLINEDDDEDDEDIKKLSSLNIIDFAHAKLSDDVDENVIIGVENIISIIEKMIID